MGFFKTLAAVVIGNLLTVAIVAGASLALFGPGLQALETRFGIAIPEVDIAFGEDLYTDQTSAPSRHPAATPPPIASQPSARLPQSGAAPTEPESDSGAIKSSAQMCRLWNGEYAKDRSTRSRDYRDQACRRFERLSGQSRTSIINAVSRPSAQQHANTILAQRRAEREAEQRERAVLDAKCERIDQRMDVIQAQLRAGYSVSEGNRLREERRKLSRQYSNECLLGR